MLKLNSVIWDKIYSNLKSNFKKTTSLGRGNHLLVLFKLLLSLRKFIKNILEFLREPRIRSKPDIKHLFTVWHNFTMEFKIYGKDTI